MPDLHSSILAAANPSQVKGLSRFFKTGPGQYGEGDKFLGIKVPVTRSIVKACWKTTGFDELERCIGSEYHELRLAALLCLVEIFSHAKTEPERRRSIEFYLSHTKRINNWDLVDLSCYPLLGVWLLDKDRSILYDLARSGKTVWEQRIGIVSTMIFIRHGQLEDTFAIADILLHHSHDLIHKAVGWLLREAGKRDRAALEAYLQGVPDFGRVDKKFPDSGHAEACSEHAVGCSEASTPRYRQMPRTMLRYAIEKFPELERQRYLKGVV